LRFKVKFGHFGLRETEYLFLKTKMRPSSNNYRDAAIGIGLLTAYYIAAKLGLSLAFPNSGAIAVWPADGLALAALLILGYRFWPAVFLGAFLANFTGSGSGAVSAAIALGNTIEPLFGAYLVNRFAGGRRVFENSQNIFKFVFFAAVIAVVCATVGVSSLALGGLAANSRYLQTWAIWLVGDMGGALALAPFLILLGSPSRTNWTTAKIFEGIIYSMVFILTARLVFGGVVIFGSKNAALDFLYIPLLLWAGFRFDRREVSGAIIALSGYAVWRTLAGFGPFASGPKDGSLLLLQVFLIVISTGSLIVSALIGEREKLKNEAMDYNQNLAREKARSDALVANIGEGLMAQDRQGKIILVNKAFEDLLGWQAREVVGEDVADVMLLEDEQGRAVLDQHRLLNQDLAPGDKITANYYLIRKNKTKFLAAITSTPLVLDGKIAGIIKIFRDITEEKQIDRSKSEFVSLASHQLRTPLTVIKWHASRLLENWDRPDADKTEQKKYAEEIYFTSQRMMELVSAILNVSKIDLGTLAIEPTHVHLEDLAEDVLLELDSKIKEKGLALERKFKQPLPSVSVDPQLMRIVFQNLLTNAIKYTPRGGRITCSISFDKESVLIFVSDTGCGIPKKDFNKVFTKFFRTEASRKMDPDGTGLGTYITKAIVEQSGGKIWFDSQEGLGTTFYVIIPLSGMKPKEGVKNLSESYS
jgi:PAS domain S-box-containing protein